VAEAPAAPAPDGLAGPADGRLHARIAAELAAPVPGPVAALAAELRRRHGPATAAVIFYGSCLRKRTTDGVLDFYVVVDDYRSAYPGRALALANAILPPNVFYLEWPHEGETLRTKYAVISGADVRRRASLRSLDCRVWARFCQPAALAFVRDDAARREAEQVVATACRTFVERTLAVLSDAELARGVTGEAIFGAGLQETYRAELRSERDHAIRELHSAWAERHDAVARDALEALEERGRCSLAETGEGFAVAIAAAERRRARRAWRLRRPLAKALAIAGLLKTAFTFGDWVPYVVWKTERQTGRRIELSERQRRHPLIFGWPVIARLIREGTYR